MGFSNRQRRRIKSGHKVSFSENEVISRGRRLPSGQWIWSYGEVVSFCKRDPGRQDQLYYQYLRGRWKKGIVYYQVLIYKVYGKYFHIGRNGPESGHQYLKRLKSYINKDLIA